MWEKDSVTTSWVLMYNWALQTSFLHHCLASYYFTEYFTNLQLSISREHLAFYRQMLGG